jgi:hypothetical protein
MADADPKIAKRQAEKERQRKQADQQKELLRKKLKRCPDYKHEEKSGVDFRRLMPHSRIDFATLSKDHGFVKARQMLLHESVREEQEQITETEKRVNDSKREVRNKESRRIG